MGAKVVHYLMSLVSVHLLYHLTSISYMVLYQDECNALKKLFKNLPATLPESPPSSLLPPRLDMEFVEEEGAWAAFNKAMHRSFGDKALGLKIQERGKGLTSTLATIRWVLKELEEKKEYDMAMLVKLWIDALAVAAKAATIPGTCLLFLLNLFHLYSQSRAHRNSPQTFYSTKPSAAPS